MCVSDDNAGHEEPLVAALYNKLFQVVSPHKLNTHAELPDPSHGPLLTCRFERAGTAAVANAVVLYQQKLTAWMAYTMFDLACGVCLPPALPRPSC